MVVDNAGYADSAPIEEMSDAGFRAEVEANLFGSVNVTLGHTGLTPATGPAAPARPGRFPLLPVVVRPPVR